MNKPEGGAYIELNDIWKIYKNEDDVIHSLSRINCSFRECSFNIIVGPSGCGKSTLIRILERHRETFPWKSAYKL